MIGRSLRIVIFTFAVFVVALGSALGAVMLTVSGEASAASAPALLVSASARGQVGGSQM